MYQTPRNPSSFHRYFSTDHHAPPLVTDSLDPGLPSSYSAGDSVTLASSPAALFLSAFSPAAAAPALEPDGEGQVVGGFTLGPIIAHGGFSTIRRATSASTGAVVAVKIVPRPRERAAQRSLVHEETVWTALSHEHILPLFACIHTPSADFFVTQLCPAGSLFDIMRGGVPTREDAGRMFRQIVRGLRYLHKEKRLVHRDVKLENVLVDEAGVCRIADFGMARGMDEGGEFDEAPVEPEGLPISSSGGAHVQRAVSLAVPRHGARRERSMNNNNNVNTTTTEFQPGSLPYAAPELLGPPPLTSSLSMSGKINAGAFNGKSSSAFVASSSAFVGSSAAFPGDQNEDHPAPSRVRGKTVASVISANSSTSSFASIPASVNGSATSSLVALPIPTQHANGTGTPIASGTSKNPAPAQDIWALGVLLYALLTGRLPFVDAFEPRLVLKILAGTYPPVPNVSARTLAVLRGCLAPRVQDRWVVERVDEAAWSVGGEDVSRVNSDNEDSPTSTSKSDSYPDSCLDDGPIESPGDARGHSHSHRRPPPAPLPLTLDRGRPGAAQRRASERAERSGSRAPYSAARSASNSNSATGSGSVSRTRTRTRSRERSARVARVEGYEHDEAQSQSRSRSQRSGSQSGSRSRSRSRSAGPRTPVDAMPPAMSMMGLSIGMGKGMGETATETVEEEMEEEMHMEEEELGRRKRVRVRAGEDAEDADVDAGMKGELLLSPEDISMEGAGRRAGSTPPVAWRGAGAGAGRSRSLSGTGTV